jgi:regulator of protease activity HflC (stomatin/prohibitin superfamily)
MNKRQLNYRVALTGFCAVVAMSLMSGCSQTVDAGNVGVAIEKPYFFGSGGVEHEVYQPGRYYFAPSTELVEYNTQPKRQDEAFHDLITKQNVPVSFDAYIQYHIIGEQAWDLHQNFGQNYYSNKLQQPFRTMVRDFARGHTVFELTTDPNITNIGQTQIKDELSKLVVSDKLPIVIDSVVIGAVSPPKEVLDETARTAAQQQRIQTETARAAAEASRKQAETNKALADKAYADSFGMNAREFLTYRSIENQREMIDIIKDKNNVNILVQTGAMGMGGQEAMPVVGVKP